MTAGIYRIVNTVTNRTYIGSSCRVTTRLKEHRWRLNCGEHPNVHLQQSWKKYPIASFVFEPLVECIAGDLVRREQEFIDAYITHDLPLYNLKPSAESRAGQRFKLSDDAKKKISAAQKGNAYSLGYKHSEGARAKISIAQKGNTNFLGHKHSDETKMKLSLAKIGCKPSEETRAKLSTAQKMRTHCNHSEETRAKISAAKKFAPRLANGQFDKQPCNLWNS